MQQTHRGWYRELNRYQWFVLVVCALGWLFDTMDQQLFNLARKPAMEELLGSKSARLVDDYGGKTTAIFLIGWATGGLIFGILGDRIGRAKTMVLTILMYSLCTGLSAISHTVREFALYRFLTGLGVGGEFAVGVAMVAETMPERARPFALGTLQALSAVGNFSAAMVSIVLGHLEEARMLGGLRIGSIQLTAWRLMFLVGALPALLVVVILLRLKEPEPWRAAVAASKGKRKLGSYVELLGDPRWRKRAIVGMLLAASGVMGLWGVGFFSLDLNRAVFRKLFEGEYRQNGSTQRDQDFVRRALQHPAELAALKEPVNPESLLSPGPEPDATMVFGAIEWLQKKHRPVTVESVLSRLDQHAPASDHKAPGQTKEQRERRRAYLSGEPQTSETLAAGAARISQRAHNLSGQLTQWGGYTAMMLNLGAFLGIFMFTIVTSYIGRRPTFAIASVASAFMTAFVFWMMNSRSDIFWMVPIMGFFQLSLFGGYAIYLPELFPTRLRSTGTSFCYNVGRFLAAASPWTLGYLTSYVFEAHAQPMRYAGVTMSGVFLLALIVLPFAPETKGQPLPE